MSMRPVWCAVGTVLLVIALGSCGGQTDEADDDPVETSQVDMPRSYRFEPEAIQVEAETTVTWTNNDNFTHDVVLLEPEEIDVGDVEPGEQVTHTFEEAGTYRYQCSFHPQQMQGVVHVISQG